jgi:AraC-like DNA-binding protein
MLKSGELTFHRPGEYHNLSGDGRVGSNISIITFDAAYEGCDFYDGKIFRLDTEERGILSMLFEEGISALAMKNESDPLLHEMRVRETAPYGYSHMIKNLLEIFLIKLRRNKDVFTKDSRLRYKVDGVNVPEWIKETVDYIGSRVYTKISVSEIASRFGVSESLLKKEFSKYYGGGVINFFHKRKVEEAKRLIREGKISFSEIADKLAFDNPQYFTKFFKNLTGLTPSEYRNSIIQ